MTSSERVAFIGGGNMARCLIGALIRAGKPTCDIVVAEPNAETRAALAHDFNIASFATGAEGVRDADVIVLCVKPQVMRAVCASLSEISQRNPAPLVMSIAAGITIAQIERWLGGNLPIVRAMPNTPALIGAGASALVANTHVDTTRRKIAQSILDAAGLSVWIDDEAQMDTVTALSGSGPAYFFLLVEALEDAAVAQGLPRTAARALVIQTCLGAGRMLHEEKATPAQLRELVTSPNGTTQAALESFKADDLHRIVASAVAAAAQRGAELSAQLD